MLSVQMKQQGGCKQVTSTIAVRLFKFGTLYPVGESPNVAVDGLIVLFYIRETHSSNLDLGPVIPTRIFRFFFCPSS